MIVVASANGRVGIERAMAVLGDGGSALDAVEAGTRLAEAMRDLRRLDAPYNSTLTIVALDAAGNPGAATNATESSIYMTDAIDRCAEAPRLTVPPEP